MQRVSMLIRDKKNRNVYYVIMRKIVNNEI